MKLLGDRYTLTVATKGSAGFTPPDDAPTARFIKLSDGTVALTRRLPLDRTGPGHVFTLGLTLASPLAAGEYVVEVSYVISSVTYTDFFPLHIAAGGTSGPMSTDLIWHQWPHADVLIRPLEDHTLKWGRRPKT